MKATTLKDDHRDEVGRRYARGVAAGLRQASDMVMAGWPMAGRLILSATHRAEERVERVVQEELRGDVS